VSSDIFGHLLDRHRSNFSSLNANVIHEAYGPTFKMGDVIGCGYNREEGTIYFTLNGKYLGTFSQFHFRLSLSLSRNSLKGLFSRNLLFVVNMHRMCLCEC
jgi:hypothetical protein